MQNTRVGINVVVVPDGVRTERVGSREICRVSLALTPKPDPQSGPTVEIGNWPKAIAEWAQHIRLAVAPLSAASCTFVEASDGQPLHSDVGTAQADEATALWNRIFGDAAGLAKLVELLREKLQPAAALSTAELDRPHVGTYLASDLGAVVESLHTAATSATLSRRFGVVQLRSARNAPAYRVDQAGDPNRPGAAWWRTMHDDWLPPAPETPGFNSLGRLRRLPNPKEDEVRTVLGEMNNAGRVLRNAPGNLAQAFDVPERANELQKAVKFFQDEGSKLEFWHPQPAPPSAAAVGVAAPTGLGPVTATARSAAATAFRKEFIRFEKCRGLNETQRIPLDDGAAEDLKNAPLRKFTGILSYPTLAKYLRLTLDVEVDWSALKAAVNVPATAAAASRVIGLLGAELVGSATPSEECKPTDFNWTAFVHADTSRTPYFGPCSKFEATGAVDPDDIVTDGVVNLRATFETVPQVGPKPAEHLDRFHLTSVAANNTLVAFQQTTRDFDDSSRKGALPAEQSTRLPTGEGRGIALNDRLVKDRYIARERAKGLAPTGPQILYAHDLLYGYRIDVALLEQSIDTRTNRRQSDVIPTVGGWEDRWRTLTARDLTYVNAIDADFLKLDAVSRVRDRDDGHVRVAVSTTTLAGKPTTPQKPEETKGRQQVTVNPQLFTWTGESLGAPSMHGGQDTDRMRPLDPIKDLAIGMDVDAPSTAADYPDDRRPPPLREDRSYVFGARAYFVNGCSIPLKDAVLRYVDTRQPVVLGDGANGFLFQRRSEIAAPDVLLPWDSKIVWAKDVEKDCPGEAVDTLVIRTGALANATTERYLVPPRASFEDNELSGQFDEIDVPPSAFTETPRLQLCANTGAFPVAIDGKWITHEKQEAARKAANQVWPNRTMKSRGSVLVIDSSATPAPESRPEARFFADPMASRVLARFVHDGKDALEYGPTSKRREYWRAGASPSTATPVLLEVRALGRRESPPDPRYTQGWFDEKIANARARAYRGGSPSVAKLSIVLAPASDVEVELWCDHDQEEMHRRMAMLAAARAFVKRRLAAGPLTLEMLNLPVNHEQTATANEGFRALLDDFINQGTKLEAALEVAPIAQVTSKRVIRVVHAVDRPLQPPCFAALESPRPDVTGQIRAVVITVAKKGTADAALPPQLQSWEAYVAAQDRTKQLDWISQAGGSTTFFVGKLAIHRRSTGLIRCYATWQEFDSVNVVRAAAGGQWEFRTPEDRTLLFRIDRIRHDDDALETERPIAPEHQGCGTSPVELLNDDGPFRRDHKTELRGLSHAFRDGRARKLTLQAVATSRFTAFYPPAPADADEVGPYDVASPKSTDCWVPATFRPAPPEVDRVLPVYYWRPDPDTDKRDPLTWSRVAKLRFYLKNWYSTGQGEELGIVFGPFTDGAGKPLTFKDFEEAHAEFSPFLARWGADLVHKSTGRLDDLIPREQFAGNLGSVDRLPLPYAFEPVVTSVPQTPATLAVGQPLVIEGAHFIRGMRASLNGRPVAVTVTGDSEASLVATEQLHSPYAVEVSNPTLTSSILRYRPEFDPYEGLWFCDVEIDPKLSYGPFVQLGLVRYQEHSVPGLELSRPVRQWLQVPPRRDGNVTIKKDVLVLEHHGVGYVATDAGPEHADRRHLTDTPLLNVRILQAVRKDHVPGLRSRGWTPVLGKDGTPMGQSHVRPIVRDDDHHVWWCLAMTLPECRPDVRYGLLIEEVEIKPGIPQDFAERGRLPAITKESPTAGTILVERSPHFSHIVDLGDESWP